MKSFNLGASNPNVGVCAREPEPQREQPRPFPLLDDLERLRARLDATIAGARYGGGLELSHLHVAMRRVQRRILPPPRLGLVRAALGEACARAADALDGTAWPSERTAVLARGVALAARETDGRLRGCRQCGLVLEAHEAPVVALVVGAGDRVTTAGPFCSASCSERDEMDREIARAIVGPDGGGA